MRLSSAIAVLLIFASVAQGASRKNALILHEGSRVLPYQGLMSHELQYDLASDRSLNVDIFEEDLDSWRLNQDQTRLAKALDAKYSGKKFDIVIADGIGAFRLLLNHPPGVLRATPVVFLSVADFQLPPKLPAHITGVATHVDYEATIQLAETLQPGLKHIYYIDSDPLSDVTKDKVLQSVFQPFRNRLDITFWEHDDVATLLGKVSGLPPHSAVLFDSYFEDPSGQTYIPAEVCALVSTRSNAPVYTLYHTMIGRGPVGGKVVDFVGIGRQGMSIALAVLHGAKISGFPVERSQNEFVIDWRQLKRFRMSPGRLPRSATVLYREPTLWTRYRWYFIGGGLIIFLQLVLILKLAIEGKRRKESEKSTRELAGRLIHAQEEERRRIAGELHDDVSQRLALICIQLDSMRGSPPSSKDALVQELSVLYDETDLISSDIHQFSHELHPAILERLGLVAALRRYCSEFALHRKITINMQTSGEEPDVHQQTALALFRVGQECLMNIAKHSGAVFCDVILNYAPDRVILKVEDKGKGFELRGLKEKPGLGIQSMRERLRSVGGTFHIDSAPLRGTKIRAEAPILWAASESTHSEFDKSTEERQNMTAA
jgi:signal transduction histidine kinase